MTSKYPVTQHAVLRYLERVENVELAPFYAAAGTDDPTLVLDAFEKETGICIAALRRKVLPPECVPALKMGASSLRCNGYVCRIESGQVVTVYKHNKRRVPIRTRRETRVMRQRGDRRAN
ncbi:hypothetical protein LC092_05345 [Stappia stellulata]|uniref:hypothetical protein n=1 Tax=Stappia stellulata TaxID=71235 RepID=UPI001CD61816|nr:hypothetical protein [Stappia stellulata]MCA1241852.1 hypothetical protein [Stappia stellulata]